MLEQLKVGLKGIIDPPYTVADFHFFFMVFWAVLFFPTYFWWKDSVLLVLIISLWANVVSHATGYSSAKGQAIIESLATEGKEETIESSE